MVVSEDSDLTLFGCDRIMFKMDANGNGLLFEKEKLCLCFGLRAEQFTFEKFRHMCIMSGCDYLPSLQGIGLGKAVKFWARVSNSNLEQVLKKIPAYLNMGHLQVTDDYVRGFVNADLTFLHQVVFDPIARTMRPLNDYPEGVTSEDMPFAGLVLDDQKLAFDLALGNLDLRSLTRVDSFDPDGGVGTAERNSKKIYGMVATTHSSIWRKDYDPANPFIATTAAESGKTEAQDYKAVVEATCFSKKRKWEPSQEPEKSHSAPPSDRRVQCGDGDDNESTGPRSSTPKAKRICEGPSSSTPQAEKVVASLHKPKVVYVSKYFTLKSAKDRDASSPELDQATPLSSEANLDDDDDEEDNLLKESISHGNSWERPTTVTSPSAKAAPPSKRAAGGSWLEELETGDGNDHAFYYNTSNLKEHDKEDEDEELKEQPGSQQGKDSTSQQRLTVVGDISKRALSQPFIPVIKETGNKENGADGNKATTVQLRNPFAKTMKSPPTPKAVSPPLSIRASQLTLSRVIDSPRRADASGDQEHSVPGPDSGQLFKSPYFSSNKERSEPLQQNLLKQKAGSTPSNARVSGLLKKRTTSPLSTPKNRQNQLQPSLLAFWSKKSPIKDGTVVRDTPR